MTPDAPSLDDALDDALGGATPDRAISHTLLDCSSHITRREVALEGPAALAAGASAWAFLPGSAFAQEAGAPDAPSDTPTLPVSLTINGDRVEARVDTRTSLLDLLRERLDLTGTKKGCNQGACGACTVHLDGERVLSCLTLAAQASGRAVTTVEGLAPLAEAQGIARDGLHPVQAAFIEHDGLQCGYCTPGQIMSAVACIREGHAGSREEIREFMSGNLCRCGAHNGIVEAIEQARDELEGRA